MKINMQNYGTEFKLHCPRCGNDEWSEEVYDSRVNLYRKCLHCGADVAIGERNTIVIVIEQPYYKFTEHTYDIIKGSDGVQSMGWKNTPTIGTCKECGKPLSVGDRVDKGMCKKCWSECHD